MNNGEAAELTRMRVFYSSGSRCVLAGAGYISDGQTFLYSGRVSTGSQPCLETGASIRGKRSKQLIYVALAHGYPRPALAEVFLRRLSVYYTVCVAVVPSRRSLPDPHLPQGPIPRVILAPRLRSAIHSKSQQPPEHTTNIKMLCFDDA